MSLINAAEKTVRAVHSCNNWFKLKPKFSGSNTFRTVKICSRQGYFELMSVYHSARSGGIIGLSFVKCMAFQHQRKLG